MTSIFDFTQSLPNKEIFEPLISANNILIERIIVNVRLETPSFRYGEEKP